MILYFSGTGNSRFAAQMFGLVTNDTVESMSDRIKRGNNDALHSERPFVFVCPTYAWRIPRIVESFIRQTQFTGSHRAYFILTCGGEPGNAARYAEKLCRHKGFAFSGLAGIVMPENYIAMFEVPDKTEADAIIQKAIPDILDAAEQIKNGRPLPPLKVALIDRIKSGIVNHVFYPFFVKAKGFYTTEACIGCGKCAALCPLNNIKLADGKPQWGQSCTHCMACICACPTEAIEYKNNSKCKPRYYNTDEPAL